MERGSDMSSVLPASAASGFAQRKGSGRPLEGFGRRHWILILCFAFCTPLTFALFGLAFGEPMHAVPIFGELLKYLVIGFTTVLLAIVGDNLLRHRFGPVWSLAIAFLAASILSTALILLVAQAVIAPLGWDAAFKMESKGLSSAQLAIVDFVGAARWSLILVVLYELMESNRRASEELHAARMTALAAQQNLVEGELRAMQARVDPELLFNSLVTIDEGYASGVEAGQHRLDALIRYLRAALPSDSADTSTVARERELAEAYVALLAQRAANPARLHLRVDADAGAEQMPSMLLLPLMRWALTAQSLRNLHVRIGRRGEMLAIEIESDARKEETAPLDEIASIRERISQLYANGAQLSIEAWRARLEIPRPTPAASQA
jgi:branched-subunit amino acid transport protein